MRRRLFTALSVLSLLILMGVAVIWVRSFFIGDDLTWTYGYGDPMRLGGNFREVNLAVCRGVAAFGERYHLIGELHVFGGVPWNVPDGLQYKRETFPANNSMEYLGLPYTNMLNVSDHRFAGCQLGWCRMTFREKGSLERYRWARLPLGYVVLLLCLPPTAWVRHILRHRKRMKGHCHACGYNLTGNTSGVCPECGTPVPAGAKA